jgi:predicted alpha/beta hydrolase
MDMVECDNLLESIPVNRMGSVYGGFDTGQCLENVAWGAGGSGAGTALSAYLSGAAMGPAGLLASAGVGGLTTFMTSPSCGDGSRTPATMLRQWAYNQLPSADSIASRVREVRTNWGGGMPHGLE